jgi:hypothetical protein
MDAGFPISHMSPGSTHETVSISTVHTVTSRQGGQLPHDGRSSQDLSEPLSPPTMMDPRGGGNPS